jgi:replicative superfamily II helicase
MDAAKYKQMSGRAGRTGFDTKGDSIMICNTMQKEYVLVTPLSYIICSIGPDEAFQV